MVKTNILARNFVNILRNGAFDESKPIGMLSPYKWSQLTQLATHHHLLQTYASGLEKYYYNDNLNISQREIDVIKTELQSVPRHGFSDLYDFNHISLHNKRLDNELQRLIQKEYTDPEKSYPTMQLMAIIIVIANQMLTGKSFIRGILDLGRYLRIDGNNVDFVKLERWLQQTKMTHMANLQGNMLMAVFGFTQDEIPFVIKADPQARRMMMNGLRYQEIHDAQTWSFRQNKSGFIVSSPSTAFKSIHHSLKFYKYAPKETLSSISKGILKGLAEIEE